MRLVQFGARTDLNFWFTTEVYTASEESGAEDSDEDIITDYLSPLDDNGNLDAAATSPGAARSPAVRISEMELPAAAGPTDGRRHSGNGVDGGPIPIISVTQHSPAASKAFYILGNNIFFK